MTYLIAALLVANLFAFARTRHITRAAADRATTAAARTEQHARTAQHAANTHANWRS